MKLSSKPVSSPSRAQKFPPPLTRFLRNNGGKRSRGRSRSSPMFVRKKNEPTSETQEPSSPKVTCIGQVRVRRSKQTATKTARTSTTTAKPRCLLIRKALFCNRFARTPKAGMSRPVLGRWFVFLQMGHRKKRENIEVSTKRESKREEIEEYEETTDEEEDEAAKVFGSPSPPKNALVLMRCRSAPCRPSSLAIDFWGSPSGTENAEQQQTEQTNGKAENPTSEKEPISRYSAAESRTGPEIEEKLGFCEGFESSANETTTEITRIEDRSRMIGSTRPLILTRCKSEPARRSGSSMRPFSGRK